MWLIRASPGCCLGALDPAVMGRGVVCRALLVRKFGTLEYMLENPRATQICPAAVPLAVVFGMRLCLGTGLVLEVLALVEDAQRWVRYCSVCLLANQVWANLQSKRQSFLENCLVRAGLGLSPVGNSKS